MNDIVKPRIALCIPHTEMMPSVFVHALVGFLGENYWISQISWGQGSDSAAARNFCIGEVPPHTTDYYLFIDSDMGFTRDSLEKLLACDKDIVSGLCFQKHHPYRPCVYRIDSTGQLEFLYNFKENSLFKIDASGGALMLVKSKVIEGMSRKNPAWNGKWFAWDLHSEDITFCMRAKEAGFETWCNTAVLADHYTMAPRGIENFRKHQEEARKTEESAQEYCWPDGEKFDLAEFRSRMIIPPVTEELVPSNIPVGLENKRLSLRGLQPLRIK